MSAAKSSRLRDSQHISNKLRWIPDHMNILIAMHIVQTWAYFIFSEQNGMG